ncbi:DUF2165 family protein [Aurantiacibacter sp. MUD11]|uniref:DUF2165 family protein n=1 Tax=Aurantiacibacter sp. MUD11 TaxID=3003265 RepID=UPI0022AB2F7A|nr:DUF2165 family protein [Aurantiacibacter sp. MUD11]WAT18646.1 DUF2165 family protein [Aurantiacibacter sp. MUD11]
MIKAALVAIIGFHALIYALQNVANIEAAHGSLVYVMSGADNTAYPDTLFFTSDNPALAWVALAIVLAGEFATAFFGLKGGWELFAARKGDTDDFHAAKRTAAIAAGFALLTWFGLFMTIGSAFFQMWQTQVGDGSLKGAFMFAMASVVTVLFVYHTPDN